MLSGLRQAWAKVGLVFETAPMQVVDRVEELGLVGDLSPWGRRLLTVAAHFAYGIGTGMSFGLLRREKGGPGEEASVGSALGVLAWGVGWASWLPLTGVHRAPWTQKTPKVLAPRNRPRGVRRGLGTPLLGAPQVARVSVEERRSREMMQQELMDLGVWLVEHPEAATKTSSP